MRQGPLVKSLPGRHCGLNRRLIQCLWIPRSLPRSHIGDPHPAHHCIAMNIFHWFEPPANKATCKPSPKAIESSTIFVRNAAEIANRVEQLMIEIVMVSRELFERRPIDPDGKLRGILELQSSVLSK